MWIVLDGVSMIAVNTGRALFVIALLLGLNRATFAGEFEGTYVVGPTICVVKPVKMSFEVRWARGVGAMYFFFEDAAPAGRIVYISKPKKNGKDRFEFDNDQHDSGRFIRSDGKIFVVKRLSDQNSAPIR